MMYRQMVVGHRERWNDGEGGVIAEGKRKQDMIFFLSGNSATVRVYRKFVSGIKGSCRPTRGVCWREEEEGSFGSFETT